MQMSKFLKRVLMLDAISCLSMGAVLLVGMNDLSPLFGLPQPLLAGAGAALVPIGLLILWVASRRQVAPLFVYAIIAGNIAWAIESLVVVASADAITTVGTAFVVGQALAVAVLTLLEMRGVARAGTTASSRQALRA